MENRLIAFIVFIAVFYPIAAHADPVSVIIAAATAAASSYTAGITVAALLGKAAIGAALSIASSLLAPKPKASKASFDGVKSGGITQSFREPVSPRKIVYGEMRTGGAFAYLGVTDSNKYLHLVIVLAAHEVQEIGEIWFNDYSIAPDHIDGTTFLVNTGRYNGKVLIKKQLGAIGQAVDATLLANVPEWDSNGVLDGCAYLYIRQEFDRDIFPSGNPNITAWVRGKKVLDTRDSTIKWTQNLALITRDYMVEDLGFNITASTIDTTELSSSANLCDEYVQSANESFNIVSVAASTDILTLDGEKLKLQTGDKVWLTSGTIGGLSSSTDYYVIAYQRSGTPRIKLASSLANCIAGTAVNITSGTTGVLLKKAEPRYWGSGVISVGEEDRTQNIEELTRCMAGYAVYAGGVWRIVAGDYRTPTISFDEGDLAGAIEIDTKISKRDRFNAVQGIFVSQYNDGNPTDYPLLKNATYATEDGATIKASLDQPYTTRPAHAQRVAKIMLERSRQEIIFRASFKLTAFQVQVGDNFYMNFGRMGWTNKIFEVVSWELGENDGAPVINIEARENVSTVYDWNNGEETTVDYAENTSLADPFTVAVVAGFSLDSILVSTQAGDKVFNVVATWDESTDTYVNSGGKYEVEYKLTTDSVYNSAGIVDGDVTQMELTALKPDVYYDVRIYAFNKLGVSSNSTDIYNFLVGSTVTTNTEDWENETLGRSGDDWEADTLTTENWE